MKNFKLTAILLGVILLVGCNQSIDDNFIINEKELTPIVLEDLPNIDSNMYVYFSSLNVKFSFSVYSMLKAIFRTSFTSDTGMKFMPDFTFSGISSKSF